MHHTDHAHQEFLKVLFGLREESLVNEVWLVARFKEHGNLNVLRDPAQADEDKSVYVFIPDLHLLSRQVEGLHQYGFLTTYRGGRDFVDRAKVLKQLLAKLVVLGAELGVEGKRLIVTQLGDYVDAWREDHPGTYSDAAQRALADNHGIHRGLLQLGAHFIRGNHDADVCVPREQLFPVPSVAFPFAPGSKVCDKNPAADILAVHGDMFDDWEKTFEGIQAGLVAHFGKERNASDYDLVRASGQPFNDPNAGRRLGSGPVCLNQSSEVLECTVNVWHTHFKFANDDSSKWWKEAHNLFEDAFQCALWLRGASVAKEADRHLLRRFSLNRGILPKLRTIVIGHSHKARICVHTGAERSFNGQDRIPSLVLCDVGAWIEDCTLRSGLQATPSCNIGVICGGDVRIYQLVPNTECTALPEPDTLHNRPLGGDLELPTVARGRVRGTPACPARKRSRRA